jgi:hypothetical protein
VWDNNGQYSPVIDADWQVRSSQNTLGSGIMYLMSQLTTPYWMYLDDDYGPRLGANDLVTEIVKELAVQPPNRLVAAHGVLMRPGASYRQCCSVQTEEPSQSISVDVAKFRAVAGHSSAVRDLPMRWPTYHTDLHVSMALAVTARRQHLVSRLFHGRMENLPEGSEAYSKKPEHYAMRNSLTQEWLENTR